MTGSLALPLAPVAVPLADDLLSAGRFSVADLAKAFQVPLNLVAPTRFPVLTVADAMTEMPYLAVGTVSDRLRFARVVETNEAALALSHAQAGPGSPDRRVS